MTGILQIEYEDRYGAPSTRRIICREVYEAEGNTYVDAFCLTAGDNRNYRRDRILSVADEATGNVTQNIEAILPATAIRPFAPGANAGREAFVGAIGLCLWAGATHTMDSAQVAAIHRLLFDTDDPTAIPLGQSVKRPVVLADLAKAARDVAEHDQGCLFDVVNECAALWNDLATKSYDEMMLLQAAVRLAGVPIEFYDTAPPTTA